MIIGDSAISGIERVTTYNGIESSVDKIQDLVAGGTLYIGTSKASATKYYSFKGYINELLFYSRALNISERTAINNYLSSKWNSNLKSSSILYSGDTSSKGDYDFNVAGIIKQTSSEILSGRTADNILSFSNSEKNPFIQISGDSLFIGNRGDKNLEIRDVPLFADGTKGERLNLTWYLDPRKTGGVIKGSINMSFDLSKIDKISSDQDKSSYIILYKKKLSDNFIKVGEATKKDKNLLSFENISIVPDSTHLFDDKKQMKLTKGYFTLARYIQSSKIEIDTNLMGDNIVSDSEKSNVLISGGAFNIEDGEKVTITIENIIKEATVNGGRWSSTFNLSTLNDGDIDIEASITLSNGLPVNSHKWTIQKDTEAPNLQQIYDVTNDNIIDAQEKLLGITIKGIGEAYSTVYITYNNISFNTISDSNGDWSFYYKSSELPTTGTSNITVYSIDKANNRSGTTTKSITVNSSLPIPRIKDNSEGTIAIGSVSFKIDWSSDVSNFTKSDLIITGAESYSLSGSGKSYTLNIYSFSKFYSFNWNRYSS